jgi:hypothetical protein
LAWRYCTWWLWLGVVLFVVVGGEHADGGGFVGGTRSSHEAHDVLSLCGGSSREE